MDLLQKNSVFPLYLQLAERIQEAIQKGTYREGEKIPTEQELMKRYGVSRVTVRLAMRELLRRGRIIRKQGMGTFVRKKTFTQNIDEIFGFFPSLVRRGLNPILRVLEYEFIAPDDEIHKILELAEGDWVLRMVRQYILEKSIVMIGQVYIPRTIAEHWTPAEAAQKNTFRLIEENAGMAIAFSDLKITAVSAKGRLAKWLECPKGSPLLQIRRVACALDHRPLEYAIFYFPAEAYEISTRIWSGEKDGLKIWEKALGKAYA
jgi:GntR family transcriptional regulator